MGAALAEPVALGIGLEGWPYPWPVHFVETAPNAGQPAVRMAYMDVPGPSADAPVALLLHGKNFDSSYWRGTIVFLHDLGYRVVVPDQVGFNKSAKPDVEYTFDYLAGNTVGLLTSLGIERVDVVVGHSTGGALAITLAARHRRIAARVVLEDPIGVVTYRDWFDEPGFDELTAVEVGYTAATYRRFMSHFFADYPPSAYEHFVEWRMRVAMSGEYDRFVAAAARTYQMIYREPRRELLAAIDVPVLITAGTCDRSTPMRRFAPEGRRSSIPSIPDVVPGLAAEHGFSLAMFAEVGHVPHLESPAQFHRALGLFLEPTEES